MHTGQRFESLTEFGPADLIPLPPHLLFFTSFIFVTFANPTDYPTPPDITLKA